MDLVSTSFSSARGVAPQLRYWVAYTFVSYYLGVCDYIEIYRGNLAVSHSSAVFDSPFSFLAAADDNPSRSPTASFASEKPPFTKFPEEDSRRRTTPGDPETSGGNGASTLKRKFQRSRVREWGSVSTVSETVRARTSSAVTTLKNRSIVPSEK